MHRPGNALTIPHAKAELAAGLAAIAGGETTVDLAGVSEVDSSAVALLLAWQRGAKKQGRPLQILNLPQGLRSLANVYGVEALVGAGTVS